MDVSVSGTISSLPPPGGVSTPAGRCRRPLLRACRSLTSFSTSCAISFASSYKAMSRFRPLRSWILLNTCFLAFGYTLVQWSSSLGSMSSSRLWSPDLRRKVFLRCERSRFCTSSVSLSSRFAASLPSTERLYTQSFWPLLKFHIAVSPSCDPVSSLRFVESKEIAENLRLPSVNLKTILPVSRLHTCTTSSSALTTWWKLVLYIAAMTGQSWEIVVRSMPCFCALAHTATDVPDATTRPPTVTP
mmetsp:Transcript_13796/g.40890  ORF Transcript_13796/g.40890 Transcript_13796/m.40890 type:complete len:245 (-) Transcript_13796:159-893(-)